MWHADADFLTETYKGSDAYVTKDGLMYAQVTTFDGSRLKFKPYPRHLAGAAWSQRPSVR